MGGQLAHLGLAPGEYHLAYVSMADMAENFTDLQSTEFGGTTDFTKLFPSVVITLEP